MLKIDLEPRGELDGRTSAAASRNTNAGWQSLRELAFPLWLRAFVRAREIGIVAVAVLIGAISGLLVGAMSDTAQMMHKIIFAIPIDTRLSAQSHVIWWRALSGPTLGGIVLSGFTLWAGNRFRNRMADAIEANALRGGRLSFGGSLYITWQTLVSSGSGGSVGLEAAYTQICSAVASLIGRGLAARRSDMRLLVGCGAAGAIAAAFSAPLAGSFYALEIVLGVYSVASFVPVISSALVATLVVRILEVEPYVPATPSILSFNGPLVLAVVLLGAICAGASIAVMQAVALADRLGANKRIPPMVRPVIGGLLVGGMGIAAPQVLGSGHGALAMAFFDSIPIATLAGLVLLKVLASSVSLGAGFRGGLFFASLLMGALVGRLYAEVLAALTPYSIDPTIAALVGMAALGSGIIGAPMTMTILALETSGNFGVTIAALIGSCITTLIVRETFGYSFATLRFHLRGETIRGPQDVGWLRELTVSKLMRKDAVVLAADTAIETGRRNFPPGSTKQVALVDGAGRYVGMVLTADLHAATPEESANAVGTLAHQQEARLLPAMTIREALDAFVAAETDVLYVLDNDVARHAIGLVTEAHALRRYGEELERRNREFAG